MSEWAVWALWKRLEGRVASGAEIGRSSVMWKIDWKVECLSRGQFGLCGRDWKVESRSENRLEVRVSVGVEVLGFVEEIGESSLVPDRRLEGQVSCGR